MFRNKEYDGAWEVPGVIGTRIEIAAPRITVLWRNAPVLTTTFKVKKRDGGAELCLKENGLRNEGTASDYAELRELFVHDGDMEMTEYFPITGESKDTLRRTENSRYGRYTVADELLREIEGDWKDESGYHELHVIGDTLRSDAESVRIHALIPAGSEPQPGCFRIVDQDPSRFEVLWYADLRFEGGVMTAYLPICDAPSVRIVFRRV
jgi:hypothetical protein